MLDMLDAFFMVQIRALEQPPHHDSEQGMRKHNGKCVYHCLSLIRCPSKFIEVTAIHDDVSIAAIIHITTHVSEIRLTGR